ncbi:predicted protein [Histoplasma capsulatum var. duboisii H88]|nr:predicted protein [Histoplasma capsulatum var. duboisii H88]
MTALLGRQNSTSGEPLHRVRPRETGIERQRVGVGRADRGLRGKGKGEGSRRGSGRGRRKVKEKGEERRGEKKKKKFVVPGWTKDLDDYSSTPSSSQLCFDLCNEWEGKGTGGEEEKDRENECWKYGQRKKQKQKKGKKKKKKSAKGSSQQRREKGKERQRRVGRAGGRVSKKLAVTARRGKGKGQGAETPRTKQETANGRARVWPVCGRSVVAGCISTHAVHSCPATGPRQASGIPGTGQGTAQPGSAVISPVPLLYLTLYAI